MCVLPVRPPFHIWRDNWRAMFSPPRPPLRGPSALSPPRPGLGLSHRKHLPSPTGREGRPPMCSLEECSLRTLCGNERLLIWQTSCFFLRLGLLTHDLLSLSPFLFTSSWELLPEKTFLQIFSVFSFILITFRSLNSAVLAWKDGVRGEGLFCPPGTLAMSGDIFLPHCCGIKISRYQQKPRKLLSISDAGTAEMRPATLRE